MFKQCLVIIRCLINGYYSVEIVFLKKVHFLYWSRKIEGTGPLKSSVAVVVFNSQNARSRMKGSEKARVKAHRLALLSSLKGIWRLNSCHSFNFCSSAIVTPCSLSRAPSWSTTLLLGEHYTCYAERYSSNQNVTSIQKNRVIQNSVISYGHIYY